VTLYKQEEEWISLWKELLSHRSQFLPDQEYHTSLLLYLIWQKPWIIRRVSRSCHCWTIDESFLFAVFLKYAWMYGTKPHIDISWITFRSSTPLSLALIFNYYDTRKWHVDIKKKKFDTYYCILYLPNRCHQNNVTRHVCFSLYNKIMCPLIESRNLFWYSVS